jgi:hypothetical protein
MYEAQGRLVQQQKIREDLERNKSVFFVPEMTNRPRRSSSHFMVLKVTE